MRILVLVKPVPEAESRLRPRADGRELDREGLQWVLAGYDESAVEQALLLKEAIGSSEVRALTYGPAPRSEELLRSALALGCDAATWVDSPEGRGSDPLDVARALALAVARYPSELLLLGKQAGDDENGLLPGALAARLDRPVWSHVVDLRWDAGSSRFRFGRAVEGGTERWEAAPPVVIGLQQAWNDPRTARLQSILRSRKLPIDRVPATEVAPVLGAEARTVPERFLLPPPRTGARLIEYRTAEEAALKLIRALREEAKVFP
jgi:electron transfer flavoprotein beta subunit